jgi:hypothetical protein
MFNPDYKLHTDENGVAKTFPNLGRTMPASAEHAVSVESHSKYFGMFLNTDVWTAGGWLVTAVQDGTTAPAGFLWHHVRKGNQAGRVLLPLDTVLFHSNGKAFAYQCEYYGFTPV